MLRLLIGLVLDSGGHAPWRSSSISGVGALVEGVELLIWSIGLLTDLSEALVEISLTYFLVVLELLQIYEHLVPVLEVLGITNVFAVLELGKSDLALSQSVLLLRCQKPGIAVPTFFDQHFGHFTW